MLLSLCTLHRSYLQALPRTPPHVPNQPRVLHPPTHGAECAAADLARAVIPRSVTVALALPIANQLDAPLAITAAAVLLQGARPSHTLQHSAVTVLGRIY